MEHKVLLPPVKHRDALLQIHCPLCAAHEKIRILRNEKDKRGRSKNYGKQIDKILEPFNEFNLVEVPAEKVVNKAKAALNKF